MSDGSEEEAGAAAMAPVDAGLLSDLYGRYRKELIAFVRAKFGSGPPEPGDVAQQAFIG